jgi:CHRD domain/PEP-CTERM motif
MKKTMLKIAVAAALAAPFAAQATLYMFNATLSGANENPAVVSSGSGIASLQYDDKGTAGNLLDDTFTVAVAGFNLSGEITGYHIHAAANTTQNAPVRVNFENSDLFTANIFGAANNNIIIGGLVAVNDPLLAPGIVDGMIPVTNPTATNPGYPSMSFLSALQSHLAYVNLHTVNNPGGEIRGQLFQVAAIPEPETYALMLAGLGLVGWVASRRRKVGV